MTPDPNNHKIVKLPDGSEMKASGANGPFYNFAESAMTGLLARKWLKDDPSFTAREGNSDQHYILVRYAEVLLNAAEAAVETFARRSGISRWMPTCLAWLPA